MDSLRISPQRSYETLRDRAVETAEAGRLVEALDLFDSALALAREVDDPNLADRAFCNWSLIAIELSQDTAAVPQLRQILVRNQDGENCRLAAYHVARAYQLRKDYKKALFYARIALDRSLLLERAEWIASSRNRIGNILLAESYFDDATEEYRQALELLEPEPSVVRAQIFCNLGYCRILEERYDEGFTLLYRSLRMLRRFGTERFEMDTHLDLSYALQETGRYRHSRRHGEQALFLAEKLGDLDARKNALYLLGQTANLSGDEDATTEYFSKLQSYYPNAPFVADFLRAIDVRKIINLKA